MGAYGKLQKQTTRPKKGFSESLLVNSLSFCVLKKITKNTEVPLKKKDSAMKEFNKQSTLTTHNKQHLIGIYCFEPAFKIAQLGKYFPNVFHLKSLTSF